MQNNEILNSWKEIGAYLQKSEKTLRRLEHNLKLPIHRIDDSPKARVYAYKNEIDEWLKRIQHSEQKDPLNNYGFDKSLIWEKIGGIRKIYAASGLAVLMVLSGSWVLMRRAGRIEAVDSIAVMPFENMTGDPRQEYFADGMTDALITNLAQIERLRVISRTSVMPYKKASKPLPDIARELNVKAVVEGSVTCSVGRVRINVRMIDASKDRHMWADSFERDSPEVLALQSELARAIVREIQMKLEPQEKERLTDKRRINPEAYQLYLQGCEHINDTFNLSKALECYRRASYLDPRYAEAHAGIARSYIAMGLSTLAAPQEVFPRARAAATKAIELDDTAGIAYSALGRITYLYDWDFAGAEKDFRHALSLSPQDADILGDYSNYLMDMGRFDEGIVIWEKRQKRDPLSARSAIGLGWCYQLARRFDDSIAHLLNIRGLYPGQTWSVDYYLASAYMYKGMHKEALETIEKAEKAARVDRTVRASIYASSGKREEALLIINSEMARSKKEYVEPVGIAIVFSCLGDKDQTMHWLTKGYEDRSCYMVCLRTFIEFDPLRSDPRFIELLKKIGFKN